MNSNNTELIYVALTMYWHSAKLVTVKLYQNYGRKIKTSRYQHCCL